MIRYLIQTDYKKLGDFPGEDHSWWSGSRAAGGGMTRDPADIVRLARHYGYRTKAAACRGLKAEQDNNQWEASLGHWFPTAHIIEVEVA